MKKRGWETTQAKIFLLKSRVVVEDKDIFILSYIYNILDNAPCLRRRSHDTGDDLVVVESNDASVLRRLVDAAPGVPAVQGGEGGAVH